MTDVINPPITLPGAAGGVHAPVVHDGHADGAHDDHGPTGILKWLTTTDHKVIGMSYMITSLVLFYLAGIMALVIRAQLAIAEQLVRLVPAAYNELFTMHGSLMLYLFAGPVRVRWPGQLHRPAAGRRAGHGLPPAERPLVLAVPDAARSR